MNTKDKTLADVFYDRRTGFSSIEHTFVAAHRIDPTITRTDVRAFIAKQEIRQRRKPLKVNSFVADLPRQEFQVDLLDMGERAKPRYGFVAFDIFTKNGACVPIPDKNADTTAEAIEKVFSELGFPSAIMSDEGGEFGGKFTEILKEEQISHLKSRTGGRFVERFIRTLKKPIYERRQAHGGNWTQYVQDVVDQYNDSVHSATKYSPDHLAEHEYDFPLQENAYQNQLKKAKFPVKHSTIQVGDHVKIRIKPKAFYKETFSSWSTEVYTVERIDRGAEDGQDRYHLTGYRRPLLRFELLKIEDVQRYKNGEATSVLNEVRHAAGRQIEEANIQRGEASSSSRPAVALREPIVTRSQSHAADIQRGEVSSSSSSSRPAVAVSPATTALRRAVAAVQREPIMTRSRSRLAGSK